MSNFLITHGPEFGIANQSYKTNQYSLDYIKHIASIPDLYAIVVVGGWFVGGNKTTHEAHIASARAIKFLEESDSNVYIMCDQHKPEYDLYEGPLSPLYWVAQNTTINGCLELGVKPPHKISNSIHLNEKIAVIGDLVYNLRYVNDNTLNPYNYILFDSLSGKSKQIFWADGPKKITISACEFLAQPNAYEGFDVRCEVDVNDMATYELLKPYTKNTAYKSFTMIFPKSHNSKNNTQHAPVNAPTQVTIDELLMQIKTPGIDNETLLQQFNEL